MCNTSTCPFPSHKYLSLLRWKCHTMLEYEVSLSALGTVHRVSSPLSLTVNVAPIGSSGVNVWSSLSVDTCIVPPSSEPGIMGNVLLHSVTRGDWGVTPCDTRWPVVFWFDTRWSLVLVPVTRWLILAWPDSICCVVPLPATRVCWFCVVPDSATRWVESSGTSWLPCEVSTTCNIGWPPSKVYKEETN